MKGTVFPFDMPGHSMTMTVSMKEALENADLSAGTTTGFVQINTVRALEKRGLVSSAWRGGRSATFTISGAYPLLTGVPLTPLGIKTALYLQARGKQPCSSTASPQKES